MLIMVTGGRDFSDAACVDRALDPFRADPDIEHLVFIQGGAKGADTLAKRWCERWMIPCITIKPEWDRLGRAAGMIRNREMLNYGPADLVIAFPGGIGTAGAVREARRMKIQVREVSNAVR